MEKFIVKGGNILQGTIKVSGAKNVSLKTLVAACLTEEEVIIKNVPLISDVYVMCEIIKDLGGQVTINDHTVSIRMKEFLNHEISLDHASHVRTSSMFIAPLLARVKEAIIPNPGGCRLGARPIDRTIDGVRSLNVDIEYMSDDGFFHAKTEGLTGVTYTFEKNTHTGTETLLLAAVLAKGTTILKNAAEEPEIDDLIDLLNRMGGKVLRSAKREITIEGVEKLHGAEFEITPDRNEIVTFAIAAYVTKGDIFIEDAQKVNLDSFLEKLEEVGGTYEKKENGIRFFYSTPLIASDVTTSIYPGFMTDWQSLWAILMTQAEGTSIIHETVFENKLGYVKDLQKMGAKMKLFNPTITNPEEIYNFNLEDDQDFYHAVEITGPTKLHNAIVSMIDLRAGAAVVIAALAATGETIIHNIYLTDRGYENLEERLCLLGANMMRIRE